MDRLHPTRASSGTLDGNRECRPNRWSQAPRPRRSPGRDIFEAHGLCATCCVRTFAGSANTRRGLIVGGGERFDRVLKWPSLYPQIRSHFTRSVHTSADPFATSEDPFTLPTSPLYLTPYPLSLSVMCRAFPVGVAAPRSYLTTSPSPCRERGRCGVRTQQLLQLLAADLFVSQPQ